ncbi:hypothetical protein ACW14Y_37740 [Kitasatospora sp. cg17-2]
MNNDVQARSKHENDGALEAKAGRTGSKQMDRRVRGVLRVALYAAIRGAAGGIGGLTVALAMDWLKRR